MQKVTDGLMVLPQCHHITSGNGINMQSWHDVLLQFICLWNNFGESMGVPWFKISRKTTHPAPLSCWYIIPCLSSCNWFLSLNTASGDVQKSELQFFRKICFSFSSWKKVKGKKKKEKGIHPKSQSSFVQEPEASLQLPLQVLSGITIFLTACGFSEDSPASKGGSYKLIFSQAILSVKSSIIILHTRSYNHGPVRCTHLFTFWIRLVIKQSPCLQGLSCLTQRSAFSLYHS